MRFDPRRNARTLLVLSVVGVLHTDPTMAGPQSRGSAARGIAEPVAIFADDDRRPLPQRLSSLVDSIGMLIDTRTGTVCTAFCAGDATVVTSAHCVLGGEAGPAPRLSDLVFRTASDAPGAIASLAGARRGAGEANVATGTPALRLTPPIAATRDWALLRLDRPACRGKALEVTPRSREDLEHLSREKRVMNVAFHRDVPGWQLAVDPTCRIQSVFPGTSRATIAADFANVDHLVLHTCDTGGASSGSPLLVDGPDGPSVVAVNAGTYVHSTVRLTDGEIVHRSDPENVANTAVGAGAFASALIAFNGADLIATGDGIAELQARLAGDGLFDGKVDGRYGPDTERAIEAFEKREGWTVTGLATTRVLARLEELDRSSAPLASGTPPPPASRTIETGSVSPKAKPKIRE
jgi:protease YdgD